ncbi:MAG TPA: alpha/beta fold hydrolase [Gemmatimonadaceae bacterium]|nr:alpha/beta fold hydrolase [Gemmatimonadaceae bacterium]
MRRRTRDAALYWGMALDARQIVLAPDAVAAKSPTGVAVSGLRLGFRALSAVAPGIAARAAARLWFMPPRPKVRADAREFLATGKRSTVVVDDRPVATWRWGSGPPVVLMHGWGGYGAQMRSFVEPLVRSGHEAVIFDAPAHGDSGPGQLGSRQTTLFEFARVLDALGTERGELAGIIAHSGGATAAAWALLSARWRARSLVMIAPMGSPSAYRKMFHDALGLNEEVHRRFTEYTARRLGFDWADLEVPGMAARAATPPLLVVHDREDVETSWDESAAIVEAWPESLLHTTTGLGHRRVLRDPGVIETVTSFIAARR